MMDNELNILDNFSNTIDETTSSAEDSMLGDTASMVKDVRGYVKWAQILFSDDQAVHIGRASAEMLSTFCRQSGFDLNLPALETVSETVVGVRS